jgi:hypothetical protein
MRTMLPRHHDGTLASLAPDSLARQRSDMELSRQRGDPRAARDAPHRRPTSGRGSRVGPAPGLYQDMVFVEDQEDEGEDEDQDEESKLADKEHAAVAHMQGARAEAARGGLQWGTRVDGRLERLERLLERSVGQNAELVARLAEADGRSDTLHDALASLRLEFEERLMEAASRPPPPAAAAESGWCGGGLGPGGVDPLMMAGQLASMQRACDELGANMAATRRDMSHSNQAEVQRAIAKESASVRADLSAVRDEMAAAAEVQAQYVKESGGALESLRMRLDERDLSSTQVPAPPYVYRARI